MPLLVLCLAAGLWPCVVVRGQMDPNDPISHPDGRADRQSDVATTSAPLPGRLTQHLWQSRIAAPAADEDAETRRSIAELIRQSGR